MQYILLIRWLQTVVIEFSTVFSAATSEEKQKQMFEKQKLAEQCDTAISVLLDKCVPDCRKLHKESTAWFM